MGYYADYNGYLCFKENPSNEVLSNLIDVFSYDGFDKTSVSAYFSGHGKYYEDNVYEALLNVKPYIKDGEFIFNGEDDCHWRIKFKNGSWDEENGDIYYSSDLPLLNSGENQGEFIGEIIDIMQDCIDNPEGDIIKGEWYDKIANELVDLMKQWKVFKR